MTLCEDEKSARQDESIMWFDSLDDVKQFVGEDYEKAHVPPAARKVLARFDERSRHYEVRDRLTY